MSACRRTIARFAGWFTAVAVGVASTALVGQTWVGASQGSGGAAFVPTAPCRLFDYRPAPNTVGSRAAALGPGEIHVQQVTGGVGDCSGAAAIPADATAVAINVTPVGPTAPSFLSVFPADLTSPPNASSLNYVPGQPPTPNTIDVRLSPSGAAKLYNAFGSVYVLGDVVGYYSDSGLAEFDARLSGLESTDAAARLGSLESANPGPRLTDLENENLPSRMATVETQAAVLTSALPKASEAHSAFTYFLAPGPRTVASVEMSAQLTGHVTVHSSVTVGESTRGDGVRCTITTGTTVESARQQVWTASGLIGDTAQLAGSRVFVHPGGTTRTYRLVCEHFGVSTPGLASDAVLTALYTPAS